jgi:hypothetical protein
MPCMVPNRRPRPIGGAVVYNGGVDAGAAVLDQLSRAKIELTARHQAKGYKRLPADRRTTIEQPLRAIPKWGQGLD